MGEPVSEARMALWRAILAGGAIGALIGAIAAVALDLILGPVSITGKLGFRAIVFLAFEAAFAGAIVGALVSAMAELKHRSHKRPHETGGPD